MMAVKNKAGVHWKDFYFKVQEVPDRFPEGPPVCYIRLRRPSNWTDRNTPSYTCSGETALEVRKRAAKQLKSPAIAGSDAGFFHVSPISKKELRKKQRYHQKRLKLIAEALCWD